MQSPLLTRVPILGVLAAGLLIGGCGSGRSTAPAPGIQPQIVNAPDDFSYQVSSVANFSGTGSYSWENTGVAANINQATTVTSGAMNLVITDAVGTQVYARSLADNGTFVTGNGVAGTWTIRVQYTFGSGTVNFRAQKKT